MATATLNGAVESGVTAGTDVAKASLDASTSNAAEVEAETVAVAAE